MYWDQTTLVAIGDSNDSAFTTNKMRCYCGVFKNIVKRSDFYLKEIVGCCVENRITGG